MLLGPLGKLPVGSVEMLASAQSLSWDWNIRGVVPPGGLGEAVPDVESCGRGGSDVSDEFGRGLVNHHRIFGRVRGSTRG